MLFIDLLNYVKFQKKKNDFARKILC